MSITLKNIDLGRDKSKSDNVLKSTQNLFKKEITFKKNKLTDKRKEAFYSELAILLSSGIDLKTSIEIIVDEQKTTTVKDIYNKILTDIINGAGLSEAILESKQFTPFEINTIKIGEESSKLIDVLNNLTEYFNKKIKQKRQLINTFSYPVIVVVTAFSAIYFMLNFMVPMFQDVFKRFNGTLPGITQTIIKISEYFSDYFYAFVVSVLILIVFLYISSGKTWYRSASSRFLLILPFIGKIVRLIYLERFFQSMALLTSAKIPLLRSIALVKEMINFYPFEIALITTEKDIMYGQPLHLCLEKFAFIDKKIISLIKVGEETNQLQFIFEKLYSQHSEELSFQMGMISSLLEPFIIIFIGLLVGLILIAMYLPMFQMSTTIM